MSLHTNVFEFKPDNSYLLQQLVVSFAIEVISMILSSFLIPSIAYKHTLDITSQPGQTLNPAIWLGDGIKPIVHGLHTHTWDNEIKLMMKHADSKLARFGSLFSVTSVSVSLVVCQDVQAVYLSYPRNCHVLHPVIAWKSGIAKDLEGPGWEQMSRCSGYTGRE